MILALVYILAISLAPVVQGVAYFIRHERAKYRVQSSPLPPLQTVAVTLDDAIPF